MSTRTARQFTETAAGYAATMVPSLRPIASEVVRRAALLPGERVLDAGTGTGTAAELASGAGRRVVGVDSAPGMLAIGRVERPELDLREMDFAALDFDDGTFDVVLAVHALLFAEDQAEALREWLRVVRPGGRLSLSVPGPAEVAPSAIYGAIYDRHGIDAAGRYPHPDGLAAVVREAGWGDVVVATDAEAEIRLVDEHAFRTWRGIGARGAATADWTPEQHESLTRAMIAVTPRDADGAFRIPFGAIYLTARRPTP